MVSQQWGMSRERRSRRGHQAAYREAIGAGIEGGREMVRGFETRPRTSRAATKR